MQRIATIDAGSLGPVAKSRTALMVGVLAAVLLAFALWTRSAAPEQTAPDSYGKLPLAFVPNAGQTDPRVRFSAQGAGYAFHFTEKQAVISLTKGTRGVALQLTPLGASPTARLEAGDRQTGRVNYLVGSEHHTNLPTYGELTYRELWPGIDMVFRGSDGALKYEFHVAPGADPSRIRLAYRGADGVSLGSAGNLLVGTPLGTLRDSRPRTYQLAGGKRVAVGSRYELQGGTGYGFALGSSYDPGRPLVIDPGLTYSTFLGGSVSDQGNGIAVDASGNAFVVGQANSSNFPTTAGAFDTTFNAQTEVFVTKLNATGSAMTYSTYLGGTGDDIGRAIAVDAFGSAYITGTAATGFPTTAGAFDTTITGTDAFVTKLNSSGSALLYSTFLGSGGSDNGQGIAVDTNGQAYVAGDTLSTLFPTTAGAFDQIGTGSNFDGFVSKLNSSGSALVFSTYLGGATNTDTATSIALGPGLSVHVAGRTISTDFPTTAGAFDTTFNGGAQDGFEAKLNATGSGLDYSTYLGGTGDEILVNVAVDPAGNAYVGGGTSSADYPTTAGAFDPLKDLSTDVFVTKLNTTGSAPVYSTFIGAGSSELAHDIAVNANGDAFITGATTSSSYPVSAGAFDTTHNGSGDVFVSRLNAAGSALTHSTFLGTNLTETGRAIAVDGNANAFVTGDTPGATFPVTAGATDTTHNGSADGFVAKLNMTPTATSGYPRSKAAAPVQVSLVPAFAACTSPDAVHGPPDLPGGTNPDGSCTPPVRQSTSVTVGAPDSNGKPVNSTGFVRLSTLNGNLATEVDEADIALTASITDVRNTDAGLTDYTGGLVVELDLRITDRFNGATHTETGTIQNIKLRLKLTCTATPGVQDIGATCAATTTADAITPSVVREGVRSVWEIGQIQVIDGGPDGDVDTTPNAVFARQGVLVP